MSENAAPQKRRVRGATAKIEELERLKTAHPTPNVAQESRIGGRKKKKK